MVAPLIEILRRIREGGTSPTPTTPSSPTFPPPSPPPVSDQSEEAAMRRAGAETTGGTYRVPRQVAGYTEDDPEGAYQCRTCAAFREPDTCLLVSGYVSPDGTCAFWSRAGSGGTDRIKNPYKKSLVNYEEHPDGFRCELCVRYSNGECTIVSPPDVSPNGRCNLFARSTRAASGRSREGGGTEKPALRPTGLGEILVPPTPTEL